MLTLSFESSAKTASVALSDGERLIAQYFQNSGLTHSRTLLPMAEALLKNQKLKVSDLELLAVACGPGSFTGVRIGISTVKGLAWAAEKKVCGISTLEAMAYNGLAAPEGALVCCAMDARRDQIYNALFEIIGGKPVRLCPDRAIAIEELAEEIKNCKKTIFFVGDGAHLCYNALGPFLADIILAPEPVRYQTAWGVSQAALNAPQLSADELLPAYLRLSQAERERREREKNNNFEG